MIKAVCFDLDGVYFTAESFQRFKKNLPKAVEDEERVGFVLAKSPQMMDFKSGKITEAEYWNFVRDELGVTIPNEHIYKVLRDSYEVNPQVVDFVKNVRKAGYKTCICSNNFVTRVRELDSKFNFLSDFDVRVLSFETGYLKPSVEIYKVLVEKAGVNPEEIGYSDDSEEKLAGARELGIQSFVYENFYQFRNELVGLGVNVEVLTE